MLSKITSCSYIDGPLVSPTMQFNLISPRDASIPVIDLSFNSSNGPPTIVTCAVDGTNLSSSQYTVTRVVTNPFHNGETPDKTYVTVNMMTSQGGEYACTVTVMGQNLEQSIILGSNTTRLNITGKCINQYLQSHNSFNFLSGGYFTIHHCY